MSRGQCGSRPGCRLAMGQPFWGKGAEGEQSRPLVIRPSARREGRNEFYVAKVVGSFTAFTNQPGPAIMSHHLWWRGMAQEPERTGCTRVRSGLKHRYEIAD